MRPTKEIEIGAVVMFVKPNRYNPGTYYACHATLYRGDGQIVHAAGSGEVKVDKLIDCLHKDSPLFSAFVIQHKDERVQASLKKIVLSSSLISTKFVYYNERRMDQFEDATHRELIELVRGIRNADRILSNKPITKDKGVSCGNLASYVIKAAIVDVLFPEGLPPSLKEKLNLIEKARANNGKKLDAVPLSLLKDFERIFKIEVELAQKNAEKLSEESIAELYRPVKHEKADALFQKMSGLDPSWDVTVMVYDKYEPRCVDLNIAVQLDPKKIIMTEKARDGAVITDKIEFISRQKKAEQWVAVAKERASNMLETLSKVDIDFYINYNSSGHTALSEIIRTCPDSYPIMVSRLTDINKKDANGNTALFYAVRYEQLDIVSDLIHRGADPSIECANSESVLTLLRSMIFTDPSFREKAYEIILKNVKFDNHPLEDEFREILFDLVSFGETKFLIMALEKCDHAVLNSQDNNGYNLLHLAIFRKNTEMVKMLLGKDISINAQTKAGNTPLMMILILGSARVNAPRLSIEVVRELMNECLAKNPDLNLKNTKDESVVSLVNELYPNDPHLSMMLECHMKKHEGEERPKPEGPK